jgi:hypothetical protein
MRVYNQTDVDNFPVVGGVRVYPKGLYEDCSFSDNCSFGEGCSFSEYCSFGEGCSFGEYCSISERCSFGGY